LAGAVQFFRTATAAGIKPILGLEPNLVADPLRQDPARGARSARTSRSSPRTDGLGQPS